VPRDRERRAAVEDADVVEPEEPALEDVPAVVVLAVDPPGEVEQELVEDPLEEVAIGDPRDAPVDLVDTPCRPGMDGRVDVREGPFVGR
jgi:hypothetical protein